MRHFSFRPALSIKGRKFKGLRGYKGKPFHPPLTDVPITAYLFAAVFDVLSCFLYDSHAAVAKEMFRAATWLFLGGAAVSVLAALTGWADWARSSEPGTQARRTVNAHAIIMIAVTVLALTDIALRLTTYADDDYATTGLAVLSAVIAVGVMVGATYGGSLVFDYGFNVETAGDSPVWHKSEIDVFPGKKPAAVPTQATDS
ncbi:MAG: putative rane protein [Actinomycetota bacterium]|nr:putative rane protein [Actinomycetota bacterium]